MSRSSGRAVPRTTIKFPKGRKASENPNLIDLRPAPPSPELRAYMKKRATPPAAPTPTRMPRTAAQKRHTKRQAGGLKSYRGQRG
jgi:hypothetical protein